MNKVNFLLSGAVLAAMSGGAFAGYNPASESFNLIVRVSGASAVDNGIFDRVDVDMCQNNANKSYLVQSGNSTSSLGNYWGVACDASAASGVTGKVLFLKRSAGGSAQGVGPVNFSQAIQFLNRASCTDADNNGIYTCPTLDSGSVPVGGVSDVAPSAFSYIINGGTGANNYSNLAAKEFASQVFGVVVNTKFRNALQALQFGSASPCVGAETEACMPSLDRSQIVSIFATNGGGKDWNFLRVNRDTLAGSNGESPYSSPATAAYRPTPFDSKIHVCRRVVGSGTQAQFQYNFLDNPSKAAVGGALTPYSQSAHSDFGIGPVVWNGSGAGDVETCLESYDSATTKTITAEFGSTVINPAPEDVANEIPAENPTPVYAWAIGIQGTEKNNTLVKAYRFIKVDGVAPTLENVWNGKYYDFAESSCQTRTGDTSGEATFVKNTCALTATNLAKLNLGSNLTFEAGGTGSGEHLWGVGGYILPSNVTGANPDGAKFSLTNPVTNYVRLNNPARTAFQNPNFIRVPFNTGNTSLDTNGSLNAAGTGITPATDKSSW